MEDKIFKDYKTRLNTLKNTMQKTNVPSRKPLNVAL